MWPWILGGLALLAVAKSRGTMPASTSNLTGVSTLEANLSQPKPIAGTTWRNVAPVDDTVQPSRDERTGNTNPLSTWLEETFGIQVPQIAPLRVTSNASAPSLAEQFQPQTPAGSWQGSDLGMPAIPGTWTPSTSQEVPAGFVDLSDPNLLMVVMPWGDDVIYVPDPVLGL